MGVAFIALAALAPDAATRPAPAVDADLLAWPFGIADEELDELAREAGYAAGFTIERRLVTTHDRIMALPRFLVTDRDTGARFAALLAGGPR